MTVDNKVTANKNINKDERLKIRKHAKW